MRNFPASSSYFASAVTRVIALKELPSSIRHIWRLWPRLSPLLLREDLAKIIPHDRRRLCGINAMPKTLLFIVVHDGARLRMEDAKALRERLDVVIRTLD